MENREPTPAGVLTSRDNRTGLPDRLKAGVEALSGLALDAAIRRERGEAPP